MIALILVGLALCVWGLFGGAPLWVAILGTIVIGAGVALRDG